MIMDLSQQVQGLRRRAEESVAAAASKPAQDDGLTKALQEREAAIQELTRKAAELRKELAAASAIQPQAAGGGADLPDVPLNVRLLSYCYPYVCVHALACALTVGVCG